jgi:hypothetical protein
MNDPRFLTSRDKGKMKKNRSFFSHLIQIFSFQAFQKIINDISVFQLDMPARATRG